MADRPGYRSGASTPGTPGTGITEEGIRRVVFAFYARVREDAVLGPVFQQRLEGRWGPHLEKMCDFWSTVLLGTRRFTGDPMGAHVGLPGIDPIHFERWMELFRSTTARELPEHQAADMTGRAARTHVVLKPNSPTGPQGPGSDP